MKRFVLILLLLVLFSSLVYAHYAPTATVYTGSDLVFLSSSLWPSFVVGGELSILSFSFSDWILSLPFRFENTTASMEKYGTRTMERGKIKVGIGGEYRKKPFFMALYLYGGITEYRGLGEIGSEYTLSLSPGITVNDHLAFVFPLEYNYSNFNPSFSLKAGIRIGGSI